MKSRLLYEIPVFSNTLTENPLLKSNGMDMLLELNGYDDNDSLIKISFWFDTVVCHKHTSTRFTSEWYDIAYERLVEIIDSKWLEELKRFNPEEFKLWNPKHYVIFLDGAGMFHFISRGYEVSIEESKK